MTEKFSAKLGFDLQSPLGDIERLKGYVTKLSDFSDEEEIQVCIRALNGYIAQIQHMVEDPAYAAEFDYDGWYEVCVCEAIDEARGCYFSASGLSL